MIESTYRHDFRHCKCGEIFVDGGHDYHRGGANDFDNFLTVNDDGTTSPLQLNTTSEVTDD